MDPRHRLQLIAIHESDDGTNGFDLTHPDLDGKNNIECRDSAGNPCPTSFGEPNTVDHGTAVAVIAAGRFGGGKLVGVAPDAGLLLSLGIEIAGNGPAFLEAEISAIKTAEDRNAVALSNSWEILNCDESKPDPVCIDHFPISELTDEPTVEPSETVDPLQPWINAYDSYQDGGVVIFARPNDDIAVGTGWYSLPTDLPFIYNALQEAWISVINASFKTGDSGEITKAERVSSPCNLSAAWCLVGTGQIQHAKADGGYTSGGGTSFVAPQIAGGVALLAQAFPDLTPAEWTARLLASANNSWFLNVNDPGYNAAVDLANRCWSFTGSASPPVCHTYSLEWGHGVMDMEAALLPIGGLHFLTGGTLTSSISVPLDKARVTTPAGSSLSLMAALGKEKIVVFDGLATDFSIRGSDILRVKARDEHNDNTLLARLSGGNPEAQHKFEQDGFSFSSSKTYENGMPTSFQMTSAPSATGTYYRLGYANQNVVTEFGGIEANTMAGPIGFARLMDDMGYAAVGQKTGALSALELFGFSGTNLNNTEGTIAGLGGRLHFGGSTTAFQLSGSFASETGSFLGVTGNEDLWFGPRTSIGTTGMSFRHSLGNGYRFGARAELGLAAQNQPGSLIHKAGNSYYSGFALNLEKQALLADNDRLNLWVKQPMRVEQSKITFKLPSGRTKDGRLLYRYHTTDMAAQSRQVDLGLSYATPLATIDGTLQLGLVHSVNDQHGPDQTNTAVAARLNIRF